VIDPEAYFYQLLLRDVAALDLEHDVAIAPTIDIDQLEHLPSILFDYTSDGQSANGPGLWGFTLTLTVFGNGLDATKALVRQLYDLVQRWGEGGGHTALDIDEDRIWITSLEDSDLFTRTQSVLIAGRNVTQYVGSFALALRS
jgi:hypothetical protein